MARIELGEVRGKLLVLPDAIKVDGNQLQLEGVFTGTKVAQAKVVAFHQIASQQEQKIWQNRSEPITIFLVGVLEKPLGQTNLNGFNYQKFLKEKGIYQTLKISNLKQVEVTSPSIFQFFQWLSVLRKKAILHCDRFFLKETAQYLKVLLLGYKTNEFSDFSEVLADLGILHLFSLSGTHVLFFIGLFRAFFLRMGISLEKVFWLQLLFAFVYGGITGYSISVVRALLQGSIKASNQRFNLKFSSLDCWSITLLIALFLNPYVLFSAAGQLSYLFSFLILYIGPISQQIKAKWLRSFVFSLLLSSCTLPIMGLAFFEWQFVGAVFTFLLLPYFELFLLPMLTFSFFFSWLLPLKILAQVLEAFFEFQTKSFYWFSQHLAFKFVIGHFSEGLFFISFLLMLLFLYYLGRKAKKACFVIVIAMLLLLNQKYFSFKGMVAFIDVGQGDSIFLQAPFHRENVLIDTGGKMNFEKEVWARPASEKKNADYSVIPFLKSRGVGSLDKVFITHGHEDHFGDLVRINQKIPIKAVYFPEGTEENKAFAKAISLLQKNGTRCYRILAREQLSSYFDLEVLAPSYPGVGKNDDSLVLEGLIAQRRFLFTGDLEKDGEQALVKQYKSQQIDVLKVGHHGSNTSTNSFFLQHFQPKEAVISCGRNNRFKHPNEEPLQALKQQRTTVFRTDEMGMVYYEWYGNTTMKPAKFVKEQD